MNDVDIILPTYNCESYIEETIKSIIGQTLKNWKLIIIDDGSTDNSIGIIKSYDDSRIVLIKNEQFFQHQINVYH